MENQRLTRWIVLGCVALLTSFVWGCGSSGGGDCERVTGLAEGYGDIEIHNDLADGVNAFFPEMAFGAFIKPGVCEIYGVPNGNVELEITQCTVLSESDCEDFGATLYLDFHVEPGSLDVVYLSDYFY